MTYNIQLNKDISRNPQACDRGYHQLLENYLWHHPCEICLDHHEYVFVEREIYWLVCELHQNS